MTRVVYALAIIASVGVTGTALQTTFRTTTDRVRVDVLVTAGDEPITGLSAADFRIWDNGVAQQVDMIEAGGGVKVLLVLDVSSSVAGERLTQLRAASERLVDALHDGDQVGLLSFSERLDYLVPLTHAHDEVRQALGRVQAGGRTALFDAIFSGVALGSGESGRWLVLVFSDGADTASWLAGERVLDAAKRSSLVVYGVTAGRARVNESQAWLEALAQATGGRVSEAGEGRDIGHVFVDLLNEYRSRYLLAFTPTRVTRGDGWHRLKVRVRGPRASHARIVARRGYLSTK
jgi:Ca-activated chloride channel homolog